TLDPQQQRRPLHQVAPGVPPALAHAIEAGLHAVPESRPSAGAMGGQITAAVPPAPIRFPEGGVARTPIPPPTPLEPGIPGPGISGPEIAGPGPESGGPELPSDTGGASSGPSLF